MSQIRDHTLGDRAGSVAASGRDRVLGGSRCQRRNAVSRQSAKTDRGAARLRNPVMMRIPELRDLRLELCSEHLGRAGGGWCGYRRRAPAGIGLPARVVIGEILDDHRAVVAFEHAQCGENDAPLERRITGRTEWPAQLERNPQCAWRFGILGLWPDQADRDRRKSLFFGARAHRSNRAEEDRQARARRSRGHLYGIAGAHKCANFGGRERCGSIGW